MTHPSQNHSHARALSVLNDFFTTQTGRTAAATQKRCARVHQHLLTFLDEGDMSRLLDHHELAALAASRRGGQGFFGALGLEAAIACLPRFVEQQWLLDTTADARAQVSLTGRLISWLERSCHLDPDLLGCALHEAQTAVRAAGPQSRSAAQPAAEASGARLTLIRGGRAEP